MCRIFTELGESYLPVIVATPGKVSLHLNVAVVLDVVVFSCLSSIPPNNTSILLTLITPYSPLPSSITQQPSSVCISLINTYGRLISLLLFSFSQDLGDLRTLTIILACVKHHQYEVSRQNHFAKSYRLLHVPVLQPMIICTYR